MKVIIGSWIINENVLHKTCGLLKTEMRERSGPAVVWCKSTQERIRQKTHVVELKGHSINFLLHIHKVGGITRDWFKNERTKIQSSRGWDILVKTTGSYVSHDATNSAFSLDLPCLGNSMLPVSQEHRFSLEKWSPSSDQHYFVRLDEAPPVSSLTALQLFSPPSIWSLLHYLQLSVHMQTVEIELHEHIDIEKSM